VIDVTDSADAEVKLTIGVPGRIVSAAVPRGTTVRQAFAQFGFRARPRSIRGWTPGDKTTARSMSLDDPINTDMTVLLLQPVVGRAAPEGIIESIVREHFGERGVRDVWVQPFGDYDGEDSLRVTVVLDPAAAEKLDGDMALDLIRALRQRLEDMGEQRFPVVEYATRDEIERLAVEA
jgi:hypothetical protein